MKDVMQKISETVDFIRRKTDFQPDFGIVLGTGLGGLAKEIDIITEIPYNQIPNFPLSTVEGHSGKLIFGSIGDRKVVAMQGRFHYYEGYSMQRVVFPIRVMKYLGIRRLFISNAAGSLNESIDKGSLMIVRDHINLQPASPFTGENYPELGSRFPDPYAAYDPAMRERALEIAAEIGLDVHTGVYVSVPGPHLETPAEYNFLHIIGGDAVGMSTVPEVLAACQMKLPVFAVSVITDKGYPMEAVEPVTIETVIAVAMEAEPRMTELMRRLITALD